MTAHSKLLSLEYIDNKLNRLARAFREFETLCYKWKQKDMKEIDELKKLIKQKN